MGIGKEKGSGIALGINGVMEKGIGILHESEIQRASLAKRTTYFF
jgi:hypothetical protein